MLLIEAHKNTSDGGKMKFYIYNPDKNFTDVTAKYLSVICNSLEKKGNTCEETERLPTVPDEQKFGAVVVYAKHAIEARKKGYRPIIYWIQGIVPEESYMRNHSRVRKFVLSMIEKKALKSSDFVLYVSEKMEKHFWKKYQFRTTSSYIMPCFSKEFPLTTFNNERYKENVFLYVGRLSVWQCFEKTVQLYKEIEKHIEDTKFLVLTPQWKEAEEYLKQYGVKNYEVSYVVPEEMSKAIQYCKFGFCLRDEDVVNYVATPTKLSDYIGNGIIPIYTKYIGDFAEISKENPYCLCVEAPDFWSKLKQLSMGPVYGEDLYNSFSKTFGDYYSSEYHEEHLIQKLSILQEQFGV